MSSPRKFELPPVVTNADGKVRTVGVEIEFGDLGAESAALVVKSLFGGMLTRHNPNAFDVDGSELGDFSIKLDTRFAGYDEQSGGFLGEVETELRNLFGAAASLVVPLEIVAPPVSLHELPEIERLLTGLREKGAGGTKAAPLFAFGLQLNPEVPRQDARTITAFLKAYAMVSPWLWNVIEPDPMRRILNFAERYPDEYIRTLAAEDYWPDMPTLIDDYIAANPTRNRDLDLLPLLCFIDEERVRSRLPDEKINSRPTFHYRLPNSLLGNTGWSLAREWNRWVVVERLAADDERLRSVCQDYLAHAWKEADWAGRIAELDVK